MDHSYTSVYQCQMTLVKKKHLRDMTKEMTVCAHTHTYTHMHTEQLQQPSSHAFLPTCMHRYYV